MLPRCWRTHDRDFDALDPADVRGNMERAFAAAEAIGIPRLLEVDDIAGVEVPCTDFDGERLLHLLTSCIATYAPAVSGLAQEPDPLSIMTYVSQYYHALNHLMRGPGSKRATDRKPEPPPSGVLPIPLPKLRSVGVRPVSCRPLHNCTTCY